MSRTPSNLLRRTGIAVAAFSLGLGAATGPAASQTTITVAVVDSIAGHNPYGDSVPMMNAIWCQIYGCMVRFDYDTSTYTSDLFESWTVEDDLHWAFTLKTGLTRHNGEPVVIEDIAHSLNRMRTDPQSKQVHRLAFVESWEIRDDRTIVIKTTEPIATLLEYLGSAIITSKAQFDAHGAEADRVAPYGAGPYKFNRLVTDNFISVTKNEGHPLLSEDNPDEVIYRIMIEPEQRVTALLNGEVQIVQTVPPQLVPRLEGDERAKLAWNDSLEVMFMVMRADTSPWDNKKVRQAVSYAVDRDAIIDTILAGQASRLDGPVGPGQVGYTPDLQPKYTYDPDKARALLAEAGFSDGPEVDFYGISGRYIADKQISEAIAAMLQEVGFKVNLKLPEYATFFADVQNGLVPFYYMGRGSVIDPSVMLAQYFGTGVSKRGGYSNPALDALLAKERQTLDPAARVTVLQEAMSMVNEESPGLFLWRHKMAWGLAPGVEFQPNPAGDPLAWNVHIVD